MLAGKVGSLVQFASESCHASRSVLISALHSGSPAVLLRFVRNGSSVEVRATSGLLPHTCGFSTSACMTNPSSLPTSTSESAAPVRPSDQLHKYYDVVICGGGIVGQSIAYHLKVVRQRSQHFFTLT